MAPRSEPVYLDHHATTPADPAVVDVVGRVLGGPVGNPHSSTHIHGQRAHSIVEAARNALADLIGSLPREIVFTSGATLSNNLALTGLAYLRSEGRDKIIISAIEHPSILETARYLGRQYGMKVIELPVDQHGFVDTESLSRSLDDKVALVSIMLGNNEIGAVQDLAEVVRLTHAVGAYVHTDATQSVGKLPVDVADIQVDMMSFSAHKMHGPVGIGALYVRDRLTIHPLVHGGEQQLSHSGTVPAALCAGFAEACRLAQQRLRDDYNYIASLRDYLWSALKTALPQVLLNGPADFSKRLPGNLSIYLPNVDVRELSAVLAPDVSISVGSACASSKTSESHVIVALGLEQERSTHSIRIGIGRTNTKKEMEFVAEKIISAVRFLTPSSAAAE